MFILIYINLFIYLLFLFKFFNLFIKLIPNQIIYNYILIENINCNNNLSNLIIMFINT